MAQPPSPPGAMPPVAGLLQPVLDSLQALANRLSIPLWEGEGPQTLSRERLVPRVDLEGLAQAELDAWFQGAADLVVTLSCRECDAPNEWTATARRHDATDLASFLSHCAGYSDKIQVTVAIEKARLVQRILAALQGGTGVSLARTSVVLYVFERALRETLERLAVTADLSLFESDFLGLAENETAPRPLVVLVGDQPGALAGPYLSILGVGRWDSGLEALAETPYPAGAAAAYALMKEACLWDERPRALTPELLELTRMEGLDPLRSAVSALQDRLIASFLANRTVRGDGGIELTFEGESSLRVTGDPSQGPGSLWDLYRWTYGDKEQARTNLEIVRRVVAKEVDERSTELGKLIELAPTLTDECDIQRRLLVDENLGRSFSRRLRMEELIRGYLDSVSDRIGALSKEVVDNTYKTVGLLVGIAIAYLLKPDLGVPILVVGILLYVLYVVFVRHFYVRSIYDEFQARRTRFDEGKQEIERLRVVVPESEKLVLAVEDRNRYFEDKHRTVSRVYAGLVIAGVILLVVFLATRFLPETEAAKRNLALVAQAERFEAMGAEDVRLVVGAWERPDRLIDEPTGRTLIPHLVASDHRGVLAFVEHVGCAEIGQADKLGRLTLLAALVERQGGRVELLTEAVCGDRSGDERIRAWLEAEGLAIPRIWSF